MFPTEKITIQVTPEAANAFRQVSDAERKKLELLLSLRLLEATRSRETLQGIMRSISQNAQAKGLTEDILKELLADE